MTFSNPGNIIVEDILAIKTFLVLIQIVEGVSLCFKVIQITLLTFLREQILINSLSQKWAFTWIVFHTPGVGNLTKYIPLIVNSHLLCDKCHYEAIKLRIQILLHKYHRHKVFPQCVVLYEHWYNPWLWKFCHKNRINKFWLLSVWI